MSATRILGGGGVVFVWKEMCGWRIVSVFRMKGHRIK